MCPSKKSETQTDLCPVSSIGDAVVCVCTAFPLSRARQVPAAGRHGTWFWGDGLVVCVFETVGTISSG